MKILTDKVVGSKRRLTVELEDGEELLAFRIGGMYQLNEPLDDIVQGHIIKGAQPVTWCPVQQKWTT